MQHVDPFDDFAEYKAMLEKDGKKLPNAVRFMIAEQVGGVA